MQIIPTFIIYLRLGILIKCNFPSQATENWSSPSLRSGEALNLSTLRSDKFIFHFDIRLREKR
jgi:hypothetical protein